MKEKKRAVMISITMAFTIIMILFIVLLYGSYMSDDGIVKNAPEEEYFSLANGIARNWSNEYYIINIIVSIEKPNKNEPIVIYTYSNTSASVDSIYCLEISMYEDGTYNIREYKWYSADGEDKAIGDWSIDSKEAYEIMINNKKIKAFMDAYPNSEIDGGLMLSNVSGTPTWYIKMVDWGIWDDPHSAEIKIDATTGEVLYVEAAPGSSLSMQDICIGAFVVLIAVVAAAVLMARKKGRENEEKMRIEMEKRNMENEIAKWDGRHGKK